MEKDREGCVKFEKERVEQADLKRAMRKMHVVSLTGEHLKCPTCGRVLLSKAGYVNHVVSHERAQKQDSFSSTTMATG